MEEYLNSARLIAQSVSRWSGDGFSSQLDWRVVDKYTTK